MSRHSFLRSLALATAALCAAVVLFAVLTLPPGAVHLSSVPSPSLRPVLAGAFHVHTTRSDGTGTVEEIAAAARTAGLQFVIFTDHGDGTRPPEQPAYHSGVLCLDAVEIGTGGGHYAAIGMRHSPYPLAGEARDVVEDVTRLGGFGIAAHPESPKAALRWREWDAPFDAMEWLNADSEWRDAPRVRLAHLLLEYLLRGPESLASLFSRPDATLARWDALTKRRRVVALAAADAHARIGWREASDPYTEATLLRAPSYETVFRTFSLHAQLDRPLTGRASVDAMALRGALAAGHVYTAIDALATPPAFEFSASSSAFSARAGDTLTLGGPVQLAARVNARDATVALLENGRRVAEGRGEVTYSAPERLAVFRAEVYLSGRQGDHAVPWIVGNPIYAGGIVDPRRPAPRAEPTEVVPIAAESTGWYIEKQAKSGGEVRVAPADRGAGLQTREITTYDIRHTTYDTATRAALDFTFTLAPGRRDNQFAALAHHLDGLQNYDRLQFRARATRPMRLSVQFRIAEPTGGERWQRSVYLDEQPRDVTVFLDDVRPIGPTSSWLPNLSRVSTVLFVVDTVNTPPGTSGVVHLEDVRWAGTK